MATIPAFFERSPDSFQPPSLDRMILLSVAKSRPWFPDIKPEFRLQDFFFYRIRSTEFHPDETYENSIASKKIEPNLRIFNRKKSKKRVEEGIVKS